MSPDRLGLFPTLSGTFGTTVQGTSHVEHILYYKHWLWPQTQGEPHCVYGYHQAMKLTTIALVCLAAAVVTYADPEPHKYHQYPYYHYYPQYHHLEPLQGDGVARHPGGGTSFVGPQVHGLTKRSADPMPETDPEPTADPDPSNSYSHQVVHHGHPHYGYHHGYRYPYNGYRYTHHYGYPYNHHSHHKRSVQSEPEPQPHYNYHGHPHYYNRYYRGYPSYYPYYAGYRYRYRG
ncbi:uncharacterized histidine-rich protein DDB_G0274557-like [Penaeus japonicus]|uniref:uncharacterized histidine-rich protein DDB_G0274557-like n=1 Tax=Penaeus japonicus TaxID=27405 RepID=UPI001C712854|nr:uncharacterized histidine-rich protein DDB_G0274557-like [Penaeus japonicus]